MTQPEDKKVPFTILTFSRCQCPRCPVQAKSQCVAELKKFKEAVTNIPLHREKTPGAYCASGRATCKDLDFSQKCLCFDCAVFAQYKLSQGQPVGYYCRDGQAK